MNIINPGLYLTFEEELRGVVFKVVATFQKIYFVDDYIGDVILQMEMPKPFCK